MADNKKITYSIVGTVLIVLAIFSGFTLEWVFEKDSTVLKRNGEIIAKTRISIEAQRTWFALDSWYDRNVKCPKIIALGGHETATRCYYPPNYYEQLSRSLIRTTITKDEPTVTKLTPYYKYGTRGAYAGKVKEVFVFEETDVEEEFPKSYDVNWKPTDTRNYQLIWRVWDLKEIDLPNGDYHDCSYKFGKVSIDLKEDCSRLVKAEVKDDRVWFYFSPSRGEQDYSVSLVDPPLIPSGDSGSDLSGNLVGFWRLDGDANVTNAFDSSGNGNNGTIIGATLTKDGRIRGAYEFDSVNTNYIFIGDKPLLDFNGTVGFSVSAWVKPEIDASNAIPIIGKYHHTNTQGFLLRIRYAAGGINEYLEFNFGGGTCKASSSINTITLGVWQHVVGVFEPGELMKLYINGVEPSYATQNAACEVVSPAGLNAIIGKRSDTASYYNGTIDETMIFNKALSATEVWKLFLGSKMTLYSGGNLTINSGGNLTFYS